MLERRWDITLKLQNLTPLHIGLGEPLPEERVPEALRLDDGTKPEVAALVRDAAGCPWIPPSSVKGLLRAAARASGLHENDPLFVALFGKVNES